MAWDEWWTGRGHPFEHDPGPPRNRRWARLFAEVPDYRSLGVETTGREAFRWHFGPMFYRGRLADGEVKVLVVGQEGAQDESLTHRAFTGGTGSRMQHVLRHLGITRSYLFLNTFCYPIFGQYGDHLRPLAQDLGSPIVAHRHRLFNYVVERNDLQLVVGVGTAAKESVATWLRSHGVDADPRALHLASAGKVTPGLRAVGVLHPGGGANGESATIAADFQRAVEAVERWRSQDPGWLPADADGVASGAAEYRYSAIPVPFRDLPFGATWRLGRGATSSNRKDEQRSIQLFSAGGRYNGRGHDPAYRSNAPGSPAGYEDEPGDLPYEPPRASPLDFDRGPDTVMARLLTPDWPQVDGAIGHPSLGFGPIHRGRHQDVTMLVLTDQGSDDDLFTGRACTGDDGQHLQAWMRAAGITRSYALLRVPPFDVTGASTAARRRWVDQPETVAAYRAAVSELAKRSDALALVITVGATAGRLAANLALEALPLHPRGAHGWRQSWDAALQTLATRRHRTDTAQPAFRYDGARAQIPRTDLPYGTLRWQGTSGDRAVQAAVDGRPSGDYYKLFVPRWVFGLAPGARP
jgi:uracil-DNA glycosylase